MTKESGGGREGRKERKRERGEEGRSLWNFLRIIFLKAVFYRFCYLRSFVPTYLQQYSKHFQQNSLPWNRIE